MPAVKRPRRYPLPEGSEEVSGPQFDAVVARQAFASDKRMADFFGVDKSQPRKWREGAVPAGEPRRLLADVAYMWRRMTADASDSTAFKWLHFDENARLGRAPLDAIRDGEVLEVARAWDANLTGGYV